MNTVVSITYDLKDADGNILESTKEPVTYLHGGHDNIFPKVEEVIHGKGSGAHGKHNGTCMFLL